jgi:hypothetical protein
LIWQVKTASLKVPLSKEWLNKYNFMKVTVSLKGRGKKMTRKGRMAQGYFTKRKGIRRFYAFETSSMGNRINARQAIPHYKKRVRKY